MPHPLRNADWIQHLKDRLPSAGSAVRGLSPKAILLGTVAALTLFAVAAGAQDIPKLQIPPQTLPNAILRSDYGASFTATGGTAPRTWELESGELPPGLTLDSTNGLISGRARAVGVYRFRVKVTDSARPPATATGNFVISVVTAFALAWKSTPQATADGIVGSVSLENQTPDDVDLTFIVVAVNEFGKAFALGYQHSMFAKGAKQPEIIFG